MRKVNKKSFAEKPLTYEEWAKIQTIVAPHAQLETVVEALKRDHNILSDKVFRAYGFYFFPIQSRFNRLMKEAKLPYRLLTVHKDHYSIMVQEN